jgi:CheY-like chemotaxis protein
MSKRRLRLRLITWNDDRASKLRGELEAAGFAVDAGPFEASTLKTLADDRPDAVVIDLGRLPSQGRDVGVAVRTRAGTRNLPLVFLDGSAEKVDRTRQQLPDATYTVSGKLSKVVRNAIAHPPTRPVVPASNLAGYSGTPLPKKLGIKGGSKVALIGPPAEFETTLGELPEAATILDEASPEADVTLWFLDSTATLEDGIEEMAAVAGGGRLWICWPKKASGITTDVTQDKVRSTGLAAGIVDFKICAIDATWSGLCFTKRKA